jgi:hypothetical protein
LARREAPAEATAGVGKLLQDIEWCEGDVEAAAHWDRLTYFRKRRVAKPWRPGRVSSSGEIIEEVGFVQLTSLNPLTCRLHSTARCNACSIAYLQTDTYFAGLTVSEVNARLFKDFLYLEHGGEISFHDSFFLLDPLKRR